MLHNTVACFLLLDPRGAFYSYCVCTYLARWGLTSVEAGSGVKTQPHQPHCTYACRQPSRVRLGCSRGGTEANLHHRPLLIWKLVPGAAAPALPAFRLRPCTALSGRHGQARAGERVKLCFCRTAPATRSRPGEVLSSMHGRCSECLKQAAAGVSCTAAIQVTLALATAENKTFCIHTVKASISSGHLSSSDVFARFGKPIPASRVGRTVIASVIRPGAQIGAVEGHCPWSVGSLVWLELNIFTRKGVSAERLEST